MLEVTEEENENLSEDSLILILAGHSEFVRRVIPLNNLRGYSIEPVKKQVRYKKLFLVIHFF
jgi:hypothetical protein